MQISSLQLLSQMMAVMPNSCELSWLSLMRQRKEPRETRKSIRIHF